MGYKNPMQAPQLTKVTISAGVGSFKDKKKIDVVIDRLSKITGQNQFEKGQGFYCSIQGSTKVIQWGTNYSPRRTHVRFS